MTWVSMILIDVFVLRYVRHIISSFFKNFIIGARIDDLEKSIGDLMSQAGIEADATPFDANQEKK